MQTDLPTEHRTSDLSRHALVWALVGTAVGALLLWTQGVAVGGPDGMLQVGPQSSLRPVVERELGQVPVSPTGGHDGQISFGIAVDLSGDEVAPLLGDAAGYRYRRVLYPALASLFGVLSGPPVLWMMFGLAAVGMGLATAGIQMLADQMRAPVLVVLAVLANPGVWLGVRVLTPDALGLGLALLGLAFAARRSDRTAIALLAAAALTKEQFLLVAIGVAIWCLLDRERVRAVLYFVAPAVPLAVWSLVLSARLGGGFDPRNSLDIPGRGIVRAIPNWALAQVDGILAWLTLALVIGTAVALLRSRSRFAASIAWPWIVLALLSSSAVWEFGNNSLRALAILAPLLALAIWGSSDPASARINWRSIGD